LGQSRAHSLSKEQAVFACSEDDGMSLLDVIKKHSPTILLGVTTVGGLFTEELIKEMASRCERPIIFPLSNPTNKAECTAEQAYEWTDGKCVFGSGSPFDEVEYKGKTYYPSQVNNVYIFPGIGLGATVCGSKIVTDRMLYVAAEALAQFTPQHDIDKGKLLPSLSTIRSASHAIACAVVREAIQSGLATKISAEEAKDIEGFVERKMYYPEYVPLVEKRDLHV
jgi:malate dehydrogenase (oxaloacetate-decarboxylating)(NADP+)